MSLYECSSTISPYLFVLSSELERETYKLSQYADDTTQFLNESKDTLRKTLDIFLWYRVVLGLAINMDKTRLAKAPPLIARCLSPQPGFESLPGHVGKLPVTWS